MVFLVAGSSFGQQALTKLDAKRGIIRTPKVSNTIAQPSLKNTNVAYFTDNFDDGDISDWTTIDNDGDTYGWDATNYGQSTDLSATAGAHSVDYAVSSASWDQTDGALTPDNWLISPSIDLSAASGTVFLEWFVAGQDQTWASEVYRVLVSTTGTAISDFTEVYADETVQASGPDGNDYWKRTADLSAYAGQTIHVAFQHHNCSDQFRINLDDISVYENTVIDGGLTAVTAPNNASGCTLTSTEPVTVTVFNYGGAAITDYTVSYSINGGTPVVENVTGANIAPASSVDYTFTQTADLSALDYYTINCNFSMTDDADGTNNINSTTATNGDGQITVAVSTDDQSGQAWEIVNANGDVIASHEDYQWNITESTDVCVMDNDCYTFNWTGGTSNDVTVSYNGTQVDQTTATGDYSVYAIGGNCSSIDAKLSALTFPGFVMPNTDVNITGTVKNVGTDAITSFDVDYTINGGASVGTYSVTGQNITTGNTYNFTHDVVFNQSTEAVYTIEVTISNVNGGTDGNTLDNVMTAGINVNSSQLERTVLIEQFTTEQCPNCPPVLAYMEGIYDNDPNCIMLTHHAGYYTDFLTNQMHGDMLDFFNDGGSTYAPAGMMDRAYDGGDHDGDGTNDPGPVFWDGEPYGGNRITEREAMPAFVSVNICGTYNTTSHVFDGKVYGEFLDNFTNVGTALFVSEDHIAQESQASAPAGFEHRYTARAVAGDRLGEAVTSPTTAGSTYEKAYTTTMDASWAYDNLYLVAFVANMNASDVNDREVANAIQIKLSDIPVCQVGVTSIENSSINIFPNPSTGIINVKGAENSTIEVLNSIGQIVLTVNNASNMESVNLSDYNEGTYIVRVITNNNITVKKVNIVK